MKFKRSFKRGSGAETLKNKSNSKITSQSTSTSTGANTSTNNKEAPKKSMSLLASFRPSPKNDKNNKKDDVMEKPQDQDQEQAPSPRFTMASAVAAAALAATATSSSPAVQQQQQQGGGGDHDIFEDEDDGSADRAAVPSLPVLLQSSSFELLAPPQIRSLTSSPPPPGRNIFRPPTDIIMIDPDAIPPSPMRDSSISNFPLQQQSQNNSNNNNNTSSSDDLLDQYRRNSSSSPNNEEVFEFGAPVGDIGMRTQLWDAQRLVRVILGKAPDKPLETGSILQAIRVFAVMKQELILLRQRQEAQDGDPPAILTSLTSPATTRNSSTAPFSTPRNNNNNSNRTSNSVRSSTTKRPEEKTALKALIEASRKITSLEKEVKQAHITMENVLQKKEREEQLQSSGLEQRLEKIETENRTLKEQLATVLYTSSSKSDQNPSTEKHDNSVVAHADLEDILTKLHSIPAKSVAPDERQLIRSYVVEMVKKTTSQQQQQALAASQKRERLAQEQIKANSKQLEDLLQKQLQINNNSNCKPSHRQSLFEAHLEEMEHELAESVSEHDDTHHNQLKNNNELKQARQALQEKDVLIDELEETQERLQSSLSRVLDTLHHSNHTKPSNDERVTTAKENTTIQDRIQLLEAQNAQRMASVHLLQRTLETVQKDKDNKVPLREWKSATSQSQAQSKSRPQQKSQPLTSQSHSQSSNNNSQRLKLLHDEHQALVATIQVLEDEMKLGT